MITSKALIQRERVSAKLLSVELEAVNFSFHVHLGVLPLPKLIGATAPRCALPHFALRNDLSSLTQQGLSPAESFAAALNCVAYVLPMPAL